MNDGIDITWQQASELFDQLSQLSAATIDHKLQTSNYTPEVKQLVQRMLLHFEATGESVTHIQHELLNEVFNSIDDNNLPNCPDNRRGYQLGPWKIESEIARGGMSRVYLAVRTDGQFEKKIALKLFDTIRYKKDPLGRFQEEVQLLAQLEHPSIARLIDAGVSNGEQAWLAMEFVDGVPINEYINTRKLTLTQKLALFIQLLAAIEYVHQHLIIHSDIKPSNVLVTSSGQVKLLDFGVSHLLKDSNQSTKVKGFTPRYAAPEQLNGANLAITSDIYSLGAVFYELINEGSYRRPDKQLEHAIPHKQSNQEILSITRKALRTKPEMRYQNIGEFRTDLENWLTHKPVLAFKNTNFYRYRKFVKRHLWMHLAYSLVVISLSSGIVATKFQTDYAKAETKRAQVMQTFIKDILMSVDPWKNQQQAVTVNQLVQDAASQLPKQLNAYPVQKADALLLMGKMLNRLNRSAQAKDINYQAYLLYRSLDDSQQLQAFSQYSVSKINLLDFDELEPQLLEAIGQAPLPPNNRASIELRLLLGELYIHLGKGKLLLPITSELLGYTNSILAMDKGVEMMGLIWLAHSESFELAGKYADAIDAANNALSYLKQVFPENHAHIGSAYGHISTANFELGNYTKAENNITKTAQIYAQVYGKTHGDTLWANYQLGRTLLEANAFERAESHFSSMRQSIEEIYGAEHNYLAMIDVNLGNIYRILNKPQDAKEHLARALSILEKNKTKGPKKEVLIASIARLESDQGNFERANDLYHHATSILSTKIGKQHPILHKVITGFMFHQLRMQQFQEVVTQAKLSCPILAEVYGNNSEFSLTCQLIAQAANFKLNPNTINLELFERSLTFFGQSNYSKKYTQELKEIRQLMIETQ